MWHNIVEWCEVDLRFQVHPDAASPRQGPHVGWTSGSVARQVQEPEDSSEVIRPKHPVTLSEICLTQPQLHGFGRQHNGNARTLFAAGDR